MMSLGFHLNPKSWVWKCLLLLSLACFFLQ